MGQPLFCISKALLSIKFLAVVDKTTCSSCPGVIDRVERMEMRMLVNMGQEPGLFLLHPSVSPAWYLLAQVGETVFN